MTTLAEIPAALAGIALAKLNERLHMRAMADRLASGTAIGALEGRYLVDIARKYGIEVAGGEETAAAASAPAAVAVLPPPAALVPGGLAGHPIANAFPLIEGVEFEELVADIAANGIAEEIVILDGMILDGRNRYRAGVAAGVFPADVNPREDWNFVHFGEEGISGAYGGDPITFVISKNLHRRHLNESQRAMIAASLATMPRGARTDIASIDARSDAEAAKLLHVGEASVERAKAVRRDGAPELADAVTRGEVSVSAAAELVKALPVEQQRALVLEVAQSPDTKRAFAGAVKQLRQEKQDEKRDRREERERVLGEKQRALPDRRYGVILADPEWRFEPWWRATGLDRAADNHYPTSAAEVIASRPVEAIADRDAVLFLWATVPMLPQALLVMAAWGFDYVSHVVWEKDRLGTGYWFRNAHELLLVGTRGNVPAPAMGTQWASSVESPPRGHSAKPAWQYELIEAYFPGLTKIELNARSGRPGWDPWGNEAPDMPDNAEAAPSLGVAEAAPLSHATLGGAASERALPAPVDDDGPELPAILRRDGAGFLTDTERARLASAFSTNDEVKPCP